MLYKVSKREKSFSEAGVRNLEQIPDAFKLSPIHQRQIEAAKSKDFAVDKNNLKKTLIPYAGKKLAFLDFETIAPPVPVWNECHSFEAIPVQWSCHILDPNGQIRHGQWLASSPEDPRPAQARALVDFMQKEKPDGVVVYFQQMESACLERLMEGAPELKKELREIQNMLMDLLPVVRNSVYHLNFNGGFGLKAVLPVLEPSLSYDKLEIDDGMVASLRLENLLLKSEGPEGLRENLLKYCEQDTLGLVRILERLREWVK